MHTGCLFAPHWQTGRQNNNERHIRRYKRHNFRACARSVRKLPPSRTGVLVEPIGAVAPAPLLDCIESGSSLRFLLPVAAALGANATFIGRGRLPERPIGELAAQLALHGVNFSSDKLPLEISGRLSGGEFSLPGDVSSQFVTGLLLALPLCGGGTIRITTPLESAPYVDITCAVMERFGVSVTKGDGFSPFCPGPRIVRPERFKPRATGSGAAFFLAAGALSGEVTVTGLSRRSPQGDKAIASLLCSFGAEVEIDDSEVTARHVGSLRACEIDVSEIPDLFACACGCGVRRERENSFSQAAVG